MPPHVDQARWFTEEVHVHEASLRSYVRGKLPVSHDVDDVVQESYLRIWRARLAHPIASSKAFLFTIARHVMSDASKRARRSPILSVEDLMAVPSIDERPSIAELLGKREKIELLGRAIGELPARCREVMVLHKIRGVPQREVARQLGLSEKTVENQVARGVRRCEAFFRCNGIDSF